MNEMKLTEQHLLHFQEYLKREEKSAATVEKYLRDARAFLHFSKDQEVTKGNTIKFKNELINKGYKIRSINSMIASINSLLKYLGWEECIIRTLRCQQRIYCSEERKLSKEEYNRLLNVASSQLKLIMQTLCATGIRVSELRYFTVEAVKNGEVIVRGKNKSRQVLLPSALRKLLMQYIKNRQIQEGPIFVTRNGNPVDRSNIWSKMKKLCEKAKVASSKVFPHNLRKLFARTFYNLDKDIAKLADILGHGSIETTRIYIMTTSNEHRRKIEQLGLVT